jgi:hypothetical protein
MAKNVPTGRSNKCLDQYIARSARLTENVFEIFMRW